ncbi:MAG TPA: ABC-2 family transporter protein [Thermomicrobiales bacterium]|nr:ABC-2 family transporter protein [Thermomicrobiales bacterium]
MTIRANLPAWMELARANMRLQYVYRFNILVGILMTAITIYLLTLVWRAAYSGEGDVGGVGLEQMLVYLTIANLQLYFLRPYVASDIQSRIREGQIGFDVSRPVSYPSQLFARATGDMIGLIPMVIVALPVAFIVGELRLPSTAGNGVAYLVSLLVAWVVAVELNMLIGLVSFWTLEMTGFQMVYTLIGNFATGALIPLWFMPDVLRVIVQLLPFQAIAYIPVSIYVGEPATGGVLSALGLQLFWAAALVVVIRWVWSHAFRHTVIQGG